MKTVLEIYSAGVATGFTTALLVAWFQYKRSEARRLMQVREMLQQCEQAEFTA